MSQVVMYWVEDDGESQISDQEWADVECLQRRTNLREYFHRGRVGFLRFTYAPRWPQLYSDSMLPASMPMAEVERHVEDLIDRGWSWEDLVRAKLAARLPGGLYASDCLLAGRSEISDLRSDLSLVVKFLLKASHIASSCVIHVSIEGDVKVPELTIQNGTMQPDGRAIGDLLEEHRWQGDEGGAAEILEALDSGDLLGPRKVAVPVLG